MKILMVSSDNEILKPQSDVFNRMKDYGALVGSLDIIVRALGSFEETRISSNTRAYPTNSFSKIFYIWDVLRTAKARKIQGIDLITAQDPFEAGLAGWILARRLKAKLQLQIHTDFLSPYFSRESLKNRIRVWIAKFLLPKADGIRVVSERVKASLICLGFPENKIFVLPIFVDTEAIKNAQVSINLHKKYTEFDFIILMASRLETEKNIGLAIDAMRDIVKIYPKTGLVIAGDGSQKENLRLRSLRLGLQGNVVFEGWVSNLASYYKTCDAFLSCSNYEGYGISIVQAASAGCPVITTDVGAVGWIISKGGAIVVDVGDKDGIVGGIEKMISDDSFRNGLSARARKVINVLETKEEYLENFKQTWELV